MKHIVRLILISLSLVSLSYGMNSMPANALELELIAVAAQGNLAQVQILVGNPAVNINAKNNDGSTALSAAAENGHKKIVKMLLAAGADIHTQANSDNYGCTALFWAAYKGHKEVVEMLLAAEAKTNANCTPLPWAAQNGYKGIVKILLAAGSDVNAKSIHNMTALHWAANYNPLPLPWATPNGYKRIVEILLAAGADVNAKAGNTNSTALHLAVKNGHKEVVDMLLAAGADVTAKDNNNYTALHYAAFNGHKEVIDMLISFNAEVPQEWLVGPWPLLLKRDMVIEAKKNQQALLNAPNFKAIAKLLSKGVYANPAVRERVRIKREQLLDAVKKDNVEEVKALLKEGFSLNTCGKDGNTLIHLAIMHNSPQVLGLLLSFYTKQDNNKLWIRKNKLGLTPVEIAVSQGNVELLRSLLATQESKSWFTRYREIIPDIKDINCAIM